jgi:DNA adenine methylase
MKPFLKWAGGKRQLLHTWILPIINKNLKNENTYFEPFVGAGSVFFELNHPKVVINDSNLDLMTCYKVIRDESSKLMEILEIYKKKHNKEYFYEIRAIDRDDLIFEKLTDVERAARMIYLNKTCFNGLYRVNKKGQFNTPIGKYKNPQIYDKDNINKISEYLNNESIIIKNEDFSKSIEGAKNGDFIYFDPPYDYESKGFTDYQKEGFNEFDLIRLKNVCDNLIEIGCHVLISNHATKRVINLFSSQNYEFIDTNYKIDYLDVNRYIGSKVQYRKKAQEVLIHGYKKK